MCGPHAPIAQLAEAADLKSAKCGFESHWGHCRAADRPVCSRLTRVSWVTPQQGSPRARGRVLGGVPAAALSAGDRAMSCCEAVECFPAVAPPPLRGRRAWLWPGGRTHAVRVRCSACADRCRFRVRQAITTTGDSIPDNGEWSQCHYARLMIPVTIHSYRESKGCVDRRNGLFTRITARLQSATGVSEFPRVWIPVALDSAIQQVGHPVRDRPWRFLGSPRELGERLPAG